MTAFIEENPISYEEFLSIIRKETGFRTYRAAASRRSLGKIPTIDDTHPIQSNPMQIPPRNLSMTKRQSKEFAELSNLILSIPPETMLSMSPSNYREDLQLGWNVSIDLWKARNIKRITILYLFRQGVDGADAPDDGDDWYNLAGKELLGWEYQIYKIKWGEEDRITTIAYQSGLTLRSNEDSLPANYHVHSDSSKILKRVFGKRSFDRFLNWRDGFSEEKIG